MKIREILKIERFNIKKIVFLIILLTFLSSIACAKDVNKKIVSVVYDDSGSMLAHEKFDNANYAFQCLTSMLNKNDELNVVRLSSPSKNEQLAINDKTSKQQSIGQISKWECDGGTPFSSIETAASWLKNNQLENGDNAEYWLFIITDGQFSNPSQIETFMEDLNKYFESSKFESVLLTIGSDIDEEFKENFDKANNTTVYEAANSSEIIKNMFEISTKISGGSSSNIVEISKVSDKEVKVSFDYPIEKMNVFIQQSDLSLTGVYDENKNSLKLDEYTIKYSNKEALMIDVSNQSGYMKKGNYYLYFDKEVDLNDTQINIFANVALENKISVYDSSKNLISDVSNYNFSEGEEITVKSELRSLIDGSKIDIDGVKNKNVVYKVNSIEKNCSINDGAAVYTFNVVPGMTSIYSIIESQGLFTVKSDSVEIVGNKYEAKDEIEAPYNTSEDYFDFAKIDFEFTGDETDIYFDNLPVGIVCEYEDKIYSNNQKIHIAQKNCTVFFKVNKNYREEDKVVCKVVADDDVLFVSSNTNTIYFNVVPLISDYEYELVDKLNTVIDFKNGGSNAFKITYSSFSSIKETLDVDEIENVNISSNNGYSVSYTINKEENCVDIKATPNIFSLFSERKIELNINSNLKDKLGTATGTIILNIENYDVWEVIKYYVLALIIIIILLGYVFKNKFNKNAYIKISTEKDSYRIASYKVGISRFIPYASEQAAIPGLNIKAKKYGKIEVSGHMASIEKVDGEENIKKKVIMTINNTELLLDVDGKQSTYSYVLLDADDVIKESEKTEKYSSDSSNSSSSNEEWF